MNGNMEQTVNNVEMVTDGDSVVSTVEIPSEPSVGYRGGQEEDSGRYSEPHRAPHRRPGRPAGSANISGGKKSAGSRVPRGLQFHHTSPAKMDLDYRGVGGAGVSGRIGAAGKMAPSPPTATTTSVSVHQKLEKMSNNRTATQESPTSDYYSARSISASNTEPKMDAQRQAFHARIFPQLVPKLTSAPSNKFDDVVSDRKVKRSHDEVNGAQYKMARKGQLQESVTTDLSIAPPIKTSVIVAATIPNKPDQVVEIVDDDDDDDEDYNDGSHDPPATATMAADQPIKVECVERHQPPVVARGNGESSLEGPHMIQQIDRQQQQLLQQQVGRIWEHQIPPLYRYMIDLRQQPNPVIAATTLSSQGLVGVPTTTSHGQLLGATPQLPPPPAVSGSHGLIQPLPPLALLHNLTLQSQLVNLIRQQQQVQLVQQGMLLAQHQPQLLAQPVGMTTQAPGGVGIPGIPGNGVNLLKPVAVTVATSSGGVGLTTTGQQDTAMASSASSSVTAATRTTRLDDETMQTGVDEGSSDRVTTLPQQQQQVSNSQEYRNNTSSSPSTPVECEDDIGDSHRNKKEEDEKSNSSVDRSGPHDVLLRVSEAHLGTLQDEDGDTPLHLAVIQENYQLVSYLIKLITSVYMSLDIANNLRQTPLHLAVITHQPHLVSLLVQAGANVNFPDRHGNSSMHLAAQRRDLKCLQSVSMATNPLPDFNLRNFDGLTPVHIATKESCVDVLKFLFQLGANKNALDATSGRSALHYAVEQENFMLVSFLMEAGVDANATTFAGNTPLHVASGRKMKDIVAVLMAYGANPGIANYEGDLPSGLPPPSLVMSKMKKYKKNT